MSRVMAYKRLSWATAQLFKKKTSLASSRQFQDQDASTRCLLGQNWGTKGFVAFCKGAGIRRRATKGC